MSSLRITAVRKLEEEALSLLRSALMDKQAA